MTFTIQYKKTSFGDWHNYECHDDLSTAIEIAVALNIISRKESISTDYRVITSENHVAYRIGFTHL